MSEIENSYGEHFNGTFRQSAVQAAQPQDVGCRQALEKAGVDRCLGRGALQLLPRPRRVAGHPGGGGGIGVLAVGHGGAIGVGLRLACGTSAQIGSNIARSLV